MTPADREGLAAIVAKIDPCDELEAHHRSQTLDWIRSAAPLYRIAKPDVPAQHLVCYFVVTDRVNGHMLLVDHINAGLLLPTGGHCDPGELPWQTVQRECQEELGIRAAADPLLGEQPLFVTVTRTRDPRGVLGVHTDVTFWHILNADSSQPLAFDRREFPAVHWMPPQQILDIPADRLDPHMHRFTRKYLTAMRTRQPARNISA